MIKISWRLSAKNAAVRGHLVACSKNVVATGRPISGYSKLRILKESDPIVISS